MGDGDWDLTGQVLLSYLLLLAAEGRGLRTVHLVAVDHVKC